MEYPILIFILGLMALTLGVTWVHKVSKKHGIIRRVGAISMSMLGCFLIWFCAAFTVPAIINEGVEVVSAGNNWMILEVQFEKVRDCKETSVDVILIHRNDQIELESNFFYKYERDGKQRGFVTFENKSYLVPDFYILEIHHACPFGVELVTMTSKYKIPPEFNLVTDDGLSL